MAIHHHCIYWAIAALILVARDFAAPDSRDVMHLSAPPSMPVEKRSPLPEVPGGAEKGQGDGDLDYVEIPVSAVRFFAPAVNRITLQLGTYVITALALTHEQVREINNMLFNMMSEIKHFERTNRQLIETDDESYFVLPDTRDLASRLESDLTDGIKKMLSPSLSQLLIASIMKSLPDFAVGQRQVGLLHGRDGKDTSRIYLQINDEETGTTSMKAVSKEQLFARYDHLFDASSSQ